MFVEHVCVEAAPHSLLNALLQQPFTSFCVQCTGAPQAKADKAAEKEKRAKRGRGPRSKAQPKSKAKGNKTQPPAAKKPRRGRKKASESEAETEEEEELPPLSDGSEHSGGVMGEEEGGDGAVVQGRQAAHVLPAEVQRTTRSRRGRAAAPTEEAAGVHAEGAPAPQVPEAAVPRQQRVRNVLGTARHMMGGANAATGHT